MSECAHDLRFDGDDVVCSKCGERRDAITGATRPPQDSSHAEAEAQRDRLAEALREADNGLAKIERQNYTGTWREIVEQHSRAAGEIRDRIAALSEIEQAASNDGEASGSADTIGTVRGRRG